MQPTDDLVQVSPWAYIGYLIAAALAVLLYRVWTSDPQTAMRRMRKELDEAREALAKYKELEMAWVNEKDALKTKLNTAQADLKDATEVALRQLARLEENVKTIDLLNQILERNEKYQHGQDQKIEWLRDRVIHLEAERGNVVKWPWNE